MPKKDHREPGFYAFSDAEYHADPCPKPSLTQTFAKLILERSPRHMWHVHPKLNPHYVSDTDIKYDLGSVAHTMLFGIGREITVIEAHDWRTNKAKDERAAAISAGNQPVLVAQYQRAQAMVRAFATDVTSFPDMGKSEVSALAQEGGTWVRTKIDWLRSDGQIVIDYKTTKSELRHDQLIAYAWSHGWHYQAAMHELILNKLRPETMGRRTHLFVLQEAYEPYVVYHFRISEALMEIGRDCIRRAIDLFRSCLKEDSWPGPTAEVLQLPPPGWALNAWATQQLEEAESRNGS